MKKALLITAWNLLTCWAFAKKLLMAKITNSALRSSYARWLDGYEWDLFVTFTHRRKLTLKSARRAMEGYFKHVSRAGPTRMFWGAEPYELRDGFHTHALLKHPDIFKYKHLAHIWQRITGNKSCSLEKWSRVDLQKFDPSRGSGHYCTKYILKGLSDWDFQQYQL